MAGMTTRELLEKLYNQDYEKLKGKKLRMTRVRVPGKEEMCIRDRCGILKNILINS